MSALAESASKIAPPHDFVSIEALRLYDALRVSRAGEHRDRLVQALYAGVVSGAIGDDDACALQATVDDLALAARASAPPQAKFAPRRRQRSPDRQASLNRRRMLAGAGVMPPNMRAAYTQGESAALAIVLSEIKRVGVCDWAVDRIAALAGVGRTTTQNALRVARRLGHLRVTERPQRGAKSLTNIVEIASPELRVWVNRGPAADREGGFKTSIADKNSGATKFIEKKERRKEAAGATRNDKRSHGGDGQRWGFEMKRRNFGPTTRSAEYWIARGTPEHEAWTARARAEGRTIPEYRSAIKGNVGFWRRSRFPPASRGGGIKSLAR